VRLLVWMIRNGEPIAVFAVMLGVVIILQILGGVYSSSFGELDEPMHLVSSLMVRDFIAALDFHHPWQFAQQYYLHYPKVGIGHWPPIFHAILGIWFLILGASRATSMMFIAIIAAATACIIYSVGKRLIGRWAGILAAVLFIASPLVQESSALVMTEHLYTLENVGKHSVLRSFRANGTGRRQPCIRHRRDISDLDERQRLGARIGAGPNPCAYQQMVPPASVGLLARGGASPGWLCSLVRPYS
jgi:hypothetical protein